jgi:hypothetical protein
MSLVLEVVMVEDWQEPCQGIGTGRGEKAAVKGRAQGSLRGGVL